MTPGQFQNCIKGYKMKLKSEMRVRDSLNHKLGQYISIGVNNPKKYPKEPYLSEKPKRYLSNEEIMRHAKAMTIAMGGTVN